MADVSFGMTFIFSLFFSGTHARSYLSGTAIFFLHGTHLPPHVPPHTHRSLPLSAALPHPYRKRRQQLNHGLPSLKWPEGPSPGAACSERKTSEPKMEGNSVEKGWIDFFVSKDGFDLHLRRICSSTSTLFFKSQIQTPQKPGSSKPIPCHLTNQTNAYF